MRDCRRIVISQQGATPNCWWMAITNVIQNSDLQNHVNDNTTAAENLRYAPNGWKNWEIMKEKPLFAKSIQDFRTQQRVKEALQWKVHHLIGHRYVLENTNGFSNSTLSALAVAIKLSANKWLCTIDINSDDNSMFCQEGTYLRIQGILNELFRATAVQVVPIADRNSFDSKIKEGGFAGAILLYTDHAVAVVPCNESRKSRLMLIDSETGRSSFDIDYTPVESYIVFIIGETATRPDKSTDVNLFRREDKGKCVVS